jgi:hypothetical protein
MGPHLLKTYIKKPLLKKCLHWRSADHGNMFGAFEFVKEAYKHRNEDKTLKVKPIVGCEFYITTDRTRKTFSKDEKDPRNHQILLAKNDIGYKKPGKAYISWIHRRHVFQIPADR